MPIVTTGLLVFIVLVVIGIIVGLTFNRYGRGWFGRQVVDASGVGDVTYSLIGIAGAFMGFHVGVILGLLPTLMLYIAAVIGAALTLWLWRGR